MTTITRDSSQQELDAYWKNAMGNRMESMWEVIRLVTVLKGFHYQEITHEGIAIAGTLDDFLDSKRPYGNKNVAQSIIFNLGWDSQRVLGFSQEPDWVAEEADKLHQLVIIAIDKEMSL